jgi:biopolymer transport protein ExbB
MSSSSFLRNAIVTAAPMMKRLNTSLFATSSVVRAAAAAAWMAAATVAQAQTGAAKPDSPYGLEALWLQSDFVAKGVLVLLALMSIGSWYVIVTKLIEQTKIGSQSRDAKKKFWGADSVRQGADTLRTDSAYRFIAEAGIVATGKHQGLLQHIALNDWVTLGIQRATERIQASLQNGLALLATVGSTAPFVGLFGTVWGIYHALTAIGVAGQASIDKVAGPVGEALIMTAIGLAVAVPAVLGYNWLVRRNKAALDEVRAFGNDLHAVILAQQSAPA